MPFPRATLGITVAATAVLATACGSSSPTPAPPSPSAAAAPVAAGARAIDAGLSPHGQYMAVASAVNLRPGDVPGFFARSKEPKSHISVHNKAFEGEGQYMRCFGVKHQTKPVFKAASDSFKFEEKLVYESVSSSVEVMPTIASVQHELETVRKTIDDAGTRQCLTGAFDALGTQSQATHVDGGTMRIALGGMRLAPVSLGTVNGTDASLGFSLSANLTYLLTVRGRTLTVPTTMHIDALAFAVGRAEFELSTTTIGPAFPSALEARLFSLLVSRAVAAGGVYPAIGATAVPAKS
jgi:hypothetical protein